MTTGATTAMTKLSREDLLEIHRQQVALFGGQHGVRDWAALDRVVSRAAAERDPYRQAASLLTELIGESPFHDGNKRCGANAALVILLLNGREPSCSPEQVVILIHALEMREMDRDGVTRFFSEYVETAA